MHAWLIYILFILLIVCSKFYKGIGCFDNIHGLVNNYSPKQLQMIEHALQRLVLITGIIKTVYNVSFIRLAITLILLNPLSTSQKELPGRLFL